MEIYSDVLPDKIVSGWLKIVIQLYWAQNSSKCLTRKRDHILGKKWITGKVYKVEVNVSQLQKQHLKYHNYIMYNNSEAENDQQPRVLLKLESSVTTNINTRFMYTKHEWNNNCD